MLLKFKKTYTPLSVFLLVAYIFLIWHASIVHTDWEALLHFGGNNFHEAFLLAKNSYFGANPRIGQLAYYFLHLLLPIHAWEMIFHPFLVILGMLLIYRLGIGKWPNSSIRSILTLLFIFISIYGFHSSIYWFLANFNWFYLSLAGLGLIILTENWFKGDLSLSIRKTILAVPLAFLSGMSQENTPAVLFALLAGCGIYWAFFKRKSRLSVSYLVIMATLLAGMCAMYFAPAREARVAFSNWDFSLSNIIYNSILSQGNWVYFIICFWRPFLIGGIMALLYAWHAKRLPVPRVELLALSFFLLWGILMAALCWGAPRGYMPMDIVLCCILCRLFYRLSDSLHPGRATALLGIHSVAMATFIIPNMVICYATHTIWKQIEEQASQCRARGEKVLVVYYKDLNYAPICITPKKIVPNFIMLHKVQGSVPLIGISQQAYDHYSGEHIIPNHYELGIGDIVANKQSAQRLGLDAVFFITDYSGQ